jgi:hypothetical protein
MSRGNRRKVKAPPIIPIRRDRFNAKDNKYAAIMSRIMPDLSLVLVNRFLAMEIGLEESIIIMQYIEFAEHFQEGENWFSILKEDLPYVFPFLKCSIKEKEDSLIARDLLHRVESDDMFTYEVAYTNIADILYTFTDEDGNSERVIIK